MAKVRNKCNVFPVVNAYHEMMIVSLYIYLYIYVCVCVCKYNIVNHDCVTITISLYLLMPADTSNAVISLANSNVFTV